jgi:3-oxo-5alpha-steroid 4-dehydrogenase
MAARSSGKWPQRVTHGMGAVVNEKERARQLTTSNRERFMGGFGSGPGAVSSSDVLAPLVVDSPQSVSWDDTADIVVVGFGAAGASAALEVSERRPTADVLVIDRFEGGGATALSGGVVYAGGTRHQREAGYDDTAEEMFAYVSREVGDAVSEQTLRRFCETSSDNLEWLERNGVPFGSAVMTEKTTYPPNGKYLYFSGNENTTAHAAHAKPAPRGHRTVGKNWTGYVFFDALRAAVERSGARLMTHSPVRRLVIDTQGAVIGVEVWRIPKSGHRRHQRLFRKVNPTRPLQNRRAERAIIKAEILENSFRDHLLIRARTGVVLATGGFIYNAGMLEQFAAKNCADNQMSLVRVGSMGCSGSGIRLGMSVGGAVGKIDKLALARNMAPPNGLLRGLIVNKAGRRFINEDAYAGNVGEAICAQDDAEGWLILDRHTLKQVLRQLLPTGDGNFLLLKLPTLGNLLFGGTRRARTIDALARKCGIDPAGLSDELARYNAAVTAGVDPLGKAGEYLSPVTRQPFYAINIALANQLAPTLSMTLGGLSVDEDTGGVRRSDGSSVPGLYAIGRSAVGICSNVYFSGTALADCVFSGRRAAAALAATTTYEPSSAHRD